MQETRFAKLPVLPHFHGDGARLCELIEVQQIDEAFDYAARVSRATVGEFLAAPSRDGAAPAIEVAVEFFVPPASLDAFAIEFDRATTRRSLGYSAARRIARLGPARLVSIPAGTFHQWRRSFGVAPEQQHRARWSADRAMLDQVLRQARHGWRECAGVA